MAPRGGLSVPTNGVLGHSLRIPSTNTELVRALSRLRRESLISVVLQWLDKKHRNFCQPYLYADHDPDDAENEHLEYDPPAQSLEELREVYEGHKKGKGSRKEIADRILCGDWRHGISLYQLAMVEERLLLDHPTSHKWYGKRLVRKREQEPGVEPGDYADDFPRFQAATFLQSLANQLSPLMKAHYYFTRQKNMHKGMGLTLMRIFMHDSPYNTEQSLHDVQPQTSGGSSAAKAVWVAFPDGSPYVYLSISTSPGQRVGYEALSLQKLLYDAVPQALSKPFKRYELQDTKLHTRSLEALLTLRGSRGSNAAPGGWSIFVDNKLNQNTLDFGINPPSKDAIKKSKPPNPAHVHDRAGKENNTRTTKRGRRNTALADEEAAESPASKRWKQVAEGRFGNSGVEGDGMALERVEVRIDDAFPASVIPAVLDEEDIQNPRPTARKSKAYGRPSRPSELDREADETASTPGAGSADWRPDVRATFYGSHVFAGIRQLAEKGVVDGERMPGWMTGEAGVSIGVVKDGKIRTRNNIV
ncbi:CHL4-domain-containing protein [Mytilinidion resinicola]|uniref:CHL4-domain-containing protein n=1 Tax=Mytilinidion resinicola TaxID=574789 RepID=A0A6A6YL62_9PEZI|nr:CHL4-domain-containing protein [Mytilinidion resinicola]KAF2809521.1 CHL4-domain-containing protein [Mytilinidion resinicola]